MTSLSLSHDWMEFVCQSEFISGISPFGEWSPTWSHKTKRYVEIATIISKGGRYADPRFLNGMIVGKPEKYLSLLRTGTDGNLRGIIPDGKDVLRLLDALVVRVEAFIDEGGTQTSKVSEDFAWNMHDELMCIHPFRSGNGRTARLMLNQIRMLCGLHVHVIKYAESTHYFQRLTEYRDRIFLPSLRK